MWFWEILNIEETDNIKEIKKAYSKLLKQYNPESNPEEYQRLRKAYDAAIDYVKNKDKTTFLNNGIEELNLKSDENLTSNDISLNNYNVKTTNFDTQSFINEVKELYFNHLERNNTELWSKLLDKYVDDNLENINYIEENLLYFINYYFCFPKKVYILFDKYFNWSEREVVIYKYCNNEIAEVVLNQVDKNHFVSCGNMYNLKNINLLEFYKKKIHVLDLSLDSSKFMEFENAIQELYNISKEDSDICGFYGLYYSKLDDFELAIDMLEKSIYYNDYNYFFTSLLAYIKLIKFQYNEAYKLLEFVHNELNCSELNELCFFTFSYAITNYNYGNYEIAKEYFNITLKYYYVLDKLMKKYVRNIESKLLGKKVPTLNFEKEYKRYIFFNTIKSYLQNPALIKLVLMFSIPIIMIICLLNVDFIEKDKDSTNINYSNIYSDTYTKLQEFNKSYEVAYPPINSNFGADSSYDKIVNSLSNVIETDFYQVSINGYMNYIKADSITNDSIYKINGKLFVGIDDTNKIVAFVGNDNNYIKNYICKDTYSYIKKIYDEELYNSIIDLYNENYTLNVNSYFYVIQ